MLFKRYVVLIAIKFDIADDITNLNLLGVADL